MAKKPDWLYKQSAVIPYIRNGISIDIVLVTSRSKSGWVLPKGVIQRFMSPEDSAAKEALEEAGVVGNVDSTPVADYDYVKWKGTCNVKVFSLEVTEILESWDEMEKRERIVVNLEEAIEKVKHEQKSSLMKFKMFLENQNACD